MTVTIFHNPKCAKSRATLKLLHDHGIDPVIIEYLKTPPTQSELLELLKRLGLKPRELLRIKEPEFRQAGLANPTLPDRAVVAAMVKYPKLIERPIVVKGRKAVLGRPPERVLALINP